MKVIWIILVVSLLNMFALRAQHTITINAELKSELKEINISQQLVYQNNSDSILNEIYLNDWANSFSSKTTPLAKRFAENYDSSFHFEKNQNRGKTTIYSITNEKLVPLNWERGDEVDILKVTLDRPLLPNESYTINFLYKVKIPSDKFTRFGVSNINNYKLKYWYLSPAVYNGIWQVYSNKNTDDLYLTPSNFTISIKTPNQYNVVSDFEVISQEVDGSSRVTTLLGVDRTKAILYLERLPSFESILTDKVEVITNINKKRVTPPIQALAIDRIIHYLDEKLGPYPFEKMVISESEYRNNPVYGLNQLPSFISPFPDGFEYDMEHLKTITRNYLENTLGLNPRNEYWLTGALQIYLMMDYVNTYYPNMKMLGKISDFWGIRWSHAASLEFNDQYPMLYLNMARNNLNQSLSTPKDSLVKFNKNIANDYYAGSGIEYLSDYLGKEIIDKSIQQFYNRYKLKPVTATDFGELLQENTEVPVNWFFDSYVHSNSPIDFKIKKVEKNGDSLRVTVKNLREDAMPVSLYGINKDSIIFKQWLPPVDSTMVVNVASKDVRKLALNYEAKIPEYNQRNNYNNFTGFLDRPIQVRILQDVEDPKYSQVFVMPVFSYNIYDGLSLGPKLYNKTVLPKAFHYDLSPMYGLRSKKLIGSGSLQYTQQFRNNNLFAMRYGISGSYFSYDTDLFYKRLTPFMTFSYRNSDLRDNTRQYINIRSVNIHRDENINNPYPEPNYSVFDLQYVYSNRNLINFFRGVGDYQISDKFSKLSATLEFRRLFLNNRQLNLRLFAGVFLYNDTNTSDDYFSFALDRPTDYLLDYNYYGRSESSGLFSQQLIIAEGGFKSQLEPAYSNTWITTLNASTNIWKWIFAYGDIGFINNRNQGTTFVYDAGIRASLVADYFELYFPIYSNLGFEPSLPHYDEKVRFIVTLDLKTLFGLFTREWY